MADALQYDVLLSHSSKDKGVARAIAERVRADGLKVWSVGWLLKPGDRIPAKIEAGPECSRVFVPCSKSANAFGSDWAQLGAGEFQTQGHHAVRDPLNKERRFLHLHSEESRSLRLDG